MHSVRTELGGNVKFFIVCIVSIFSFSAFAERHCEVLGENGLESCVEVTNEAGKIASCEAPAEVDEGGLESAFGHEENPINFCNKKMLFGGEKLSAKEIKKKKKKLRKQCKKKAKAYKKAVAKEYLKKFKLGQFLQARLKSKNKIIKGSGVKNDKVKLELGFTPEQVKNMSKEEFSSHMMNKIRQQVPSIDELMAQSDPKNAFKGSIAKQESFPMSIVVGTKGGQNCVVESPDFPADEDFTPETCELCKDTEMQDNFTNDCAYMVSDNLSEKEARKLVGASKSKQKAGSDSHCNTSMDGVKNDMSQIDKTADRLCSIAQEGLTPDFEINSSRNMFNDYTPDLAAKRGQFTQKYLYKKISKNCDIDKDDMPDWLKSEEAFGEKVKVKHPEYKRPDNVAGNYGPNPYAEGSAREDEKKYLAETLKYEFDEIKKKSDKYYNQISEIDKELTQINQKINGGNGEAGLKKQYDETKKSLDKPDLRFIKDQQIFLSKVSQEAHLYYARKKKLQQDKHDLNKRIENLQKEMKSPKYQKSNGEFLLVSKLDAFYKEKDATGSTKAFRQKWDADLFNQFKMARISGDVSRENDFGIPEDMMTPELSLALNSLVEIKSYTCQLNPISTKKVKLEGILKGALKVVTAATLPVVGLVGAGATVAVSPITTGISLFCKGCREPGRTPPILQWGNLFHLDLSKRGRRRAWKGTKGFINNYINWGGALKVSKNKSVTKHDLQKYADKIGNKPYGSMSPEEQGQLLDKVLEEMTNEENKMCLKRTYEYGDTEKSENNVPVDPVKKETNTINGGNQQ
jgi:hypothetical protein